MNEDVVERVIADLKAAEAALNEDNKRAMWGADVDSRAEMRAENVGHNVMLHEAIKVVRAALATLPASQVPGELREVLDALQPFADGVFNDNGDLTIRTVFDAEAVERAYFVHKRLSRLPTEDDPK